MSDDNQVKVDITGSVSPSVRAAAQEASSSLSSIAEAHRQLGLALKNSGATEEQQRFIVELKRKYDLIGKVPAEVAVYEAAMRGFKGADLEIISVMAQKIDAMEAQAVTMSRLAAGAGILATAIGAFLGKAFLDSIAQAREAEQAHLRLAVTIKATGLAAGLTIQDLDAMAESMKATTGFDDDKLRESMAVLLTFRNVSKEHFGDVMVAAADLSRLMGQDLKSSVLMLGKAIEDPTTGLTALRRAGISFSDQTRDMIRDLAATGQQAEATNLILNTLREQGINGTAEAMNTGISKATNDAKMAWDDLLKSFGQTSVVQGTVIGVLEAITAKLDLLQGKVKDDTFWGRWQAMISGGPLLGPASLLAGAAMRTEESGPTVGQNYKSLRDTENAIAGQARKEAADAAERTRKSQQEYLELTQKLNGVNKEFFSNLKVLHQEYERGGLSVEQYRAQVAQLIKTQTEIGRDKGGKAGLPLYLEEVQRLTKLAAKELEAFERKDLEHLEEVQRLANLAAKEQEALNKQQEAYARNLQSSLGPLEHQAIMLEREVENYGKAASAILRTQIARLEEARSIAAANGAWDQHLNYLDQEIEARRRMLVAATSLETMQASTETWQSIDRVAHDTFISIADGGKDTAQRLKESFKNIFFDFLYQMTVKQWLINVSSSISGSQVAGQAFGHAGETAGGLGNMLSAGSNIAGLFGLGGSGAAMGTVGASNLIGMGGGDALGSLIEMNAGNWGLSGGGSALGMLGQALPYIGAALAVISLFSKKGGGPKTEGDTYYGVGDFKDYGGAFSSADSGYTGHSADSQLAPLGRSTAAGVEKLIEALGGSADQYAVHLGYNSDPAGTAPDNVTGGLIDRTTGRRVYSNTTDTGRGESGKQLELEVKRLMVAAIQNSDVDVLVKSMVNGIDVAKSSAEELDQVLASVTAHAENLATIKAYGEADPFADYAKAAERAGMTLMGAWQIQGDALADLVAEYDGGAAATAELAALTSARYQTELQLAQQITEVLGSTQSMIGDSIRGIQLSVLDAKGQYEYLDQEAKRYRDTLATLTDPALIDDYMKKMNATLNQAYGLLDEDQKKAKAGEFIDRFNDVKDVVEKQLSAAEATVRADRETQTAAFSTAMQKIAAEAAAAIERAAATIPSHIAIDIHDNRTQVSTEVEG